MTGTFYAHRDGTVAVHFHATLNGWSWMSLKLQQPGTTETDVDDAWNTIGQHTHDTQRLRLKWRMSACFCPFRDFIAWIEAIACGVQRCEWYWNGEGPDYAVEWNSAQLVFSEDGAELFRVRLARRNVLRAFYCSFRRFALSLRYRPGEWENRPSIDVLLEEMGDRLTAEELRGWLLMQDAAGLQRALLPATAVVTASEDFEPKDEFRPATDAEEAIFGGSEQLRHLVHRLVSAEWNAWPLERRRAELDAILTSPTGGYGGSRLRTLRSPIVERFLDMHVQEDADLRQRRGEVLLRNDNDAPSGNATA